MFGLNSYLTGFLITISTAIAVWLVSPVKRDVSIVDNLCPLIFLLAAVTYTLSLSEAGPRTVLVLVMVCVWAIRLFAYITWRNWGEAEDRRYQAIRANNEPNFELKSVYIVFGLQGIIAWVASLPAYADYIACTSAFIPCPPKKVGSIVQQSN